MTIKEAHQYAIESLRHHIIDDRELHGVVAILFEDCWRIKSLSSSDDFRMGKELNEKLDLLKNGVPIQYVTTVSYFYGYKLYVNEHVLIPRPETEELAHWIIADQKNSRRSLSIIDVGTGSGCIPIALKKNLTNSVINAIDVSVDALNVAQKNARQHQVDIHFSEVDFMSDDHRATLGFYDVIVSNPPYIGRDEEQSMGSDVIRYEPDIALFPFGEDRLVFYRLLADFGLSHLKSGGLIYVEINEFYPTETEVIFMEKGYQVELKDDLQGRPRMLKAWR